MMMAVQPSKQQQQPAPVAPLTTQQFVNNSGLLAQEEEEEEKAREPMNPLMIKLVLENLFRYCNFRQLSDCRLVCKDWLEHSRPQWLRSGPKLELCLKDNEDASADDKTMGEFLGTVHNDFHSYGPYEYSGLQCYQKFSLDRVGPQNQLHVVREFFRVAGEWMMELELRLDNPDSDTYAAVMLSKFTPSLAKLSVNVTFKEDNNKLEPLPFLGDHLQLRSLKLDRNRSGANQEDPRIEGALLRRYPKLQTLVQGDIGFACAIDVKDLSEAIYKVRQADSTMLDLKHLEIYWNREPPSALLKLFRNTPLTLETLGITVGDGIQNQTIHKLLDSQASSTLKKLMVWKQYRGPPENDFDPPLMRSIQTLELYGYPFGGFLALLKKFPSLESVLLHDTFFSFEKGFLLPIVAGGQPDELVDDVVIPTLTQFHCDYDEDVSRLSPEQVQKLGKLMPNLKDLQCWLTNDSFREACKAWSSSGLEHLHILGDDMDDEGLTGMVEGVKKFKDNITVLQELKSLKMTHWDWKLSDFAKKITLQSAVLGFMRLPLLKNVEIGYDEKRDRY